MRLIPLSIVLVLLAGCAAFDRQAPDQYMVFFSSGNIELSPDARAVVAKAASTIRNTHPQSVMIAAGEATGDNLKLAQPRFNAVRDALIADGVDPELIARTAIADTALNAGATGDQRVEIKLVAKPAT